MRKTIFLLVGFGTCFLLTSCAHRYHLFSTGAVSMTRYSFPSKAKFEELAPVQTQYCRSEAQNFTEVGLLDQVIRKAQKSTQADVIRNASFAMKGSCITLDGVAYRIKK